jgi:hypothetical protein
MKNKARSQGFWFVPLALLADICPESWSFLGRPTELEVYGLFYFTNAAEVILFALVKTD